MRTLDRRHHSHPLLDFAIDGNVGMWNENAGTVYNAREYRRLLERLMGYDVVATPGTGSGGIFRSGDLAVSQRGAGANMSVDVALGAAYVDNNASSTGGGYFVYSDAVVNVPITASDPTNPRKDLIGVAVRDTEYAGATNDAQVTVITGTAAGVPSEPSVPATYHGWVTLALVDVAAAAASITNANITNRRRTMTALGGTIVVDTEATLPTTNLWNGMVALVLAHSSYNNAAVVVARIGGAWVPWKRLDSFSTIAGEQVLLAESNPSGTGSVTLWNASLTGIRMLVLDWFGSTTNGAEQPFYLRLNNDSAVNAYRTEIEYSSNGGAASTYAADLTGARLGQMVRTGGSRIAHGVARWPVDAFQGKIGITHQSAQHIPGTVYQIEQGASVWQNGATVSRVDAVIAAGNYTSGSKLLLYGIRA